MYSRFFAACAGSARSTVRASSANRETELSSHFQSESRLRRMHKSWCMGLVAACSCAVALLSGCGSIAGGPASGVPGALVPSSSSISFGTVTVGQTASATVSLRNESIDPVKISQINVSGQEFTLAGQNNLPATVASAGVYTVTVQFRPTAAGSAAGDLTVVSNSDSGTSTITLSGTGASTGSTASPAALSAVSCDSESIVGMGSDNCAVTLTAAAPAGGMVVNLASSSASVTVPATVTVAAGSLSAGFSATVAAVTAAQTATLSAAAGGATETFALQLSVSGPALTVGSTTVSFGNVSLNTPATQSVTLTSSGTTALTISAGTMTGTGFTMSGVTFPATLTPGQTATLDLQFDPATSGAATGLVTLSDNVTGAATATIALNGTGISATGYQVQLTWNAPESTTDPAVGYNIYRAANGSATYTLLNSSVNTPTTFTDTTVQDGTSYTYEVTSVDASGVQSVPSNPYTAAIP